MLLGQGGKLAGRLCAYAWRRLEHYCSATKVAEAVRRPSRPRAERACAGTQESAERRALSGPPAQFHLGCRFMQAWAEPGHDGGWSATPSRAAHVAQGILPAGHPSWHVLAPWPPGLSIFGATGMLPVTQLPHCSDLHYCIPASAVAGCRLCQVNSGAVVSVAA